MNLNWYKKAKNKNFKIASMDVWVPEANLPIEIQTMFHLSNEVHSLLCRHFDKTMTPNQIKHFTDNRIYPNVEFNETTTKWTDENGIIDVYMRGITRDKYKEVKDFVINTLDKLKIDFTPPTELEKSEIYDSYVFKYIINRIPKDILNRPPQLNMSNANARNIFVDILGYPNDDNFIRLDARDLVNRINNVKERNIQEFTHEGREGDEIFGIIPGMENDFDEESKKGRKGPKMYEPPKPKTYFDNRLNTIKEIALWAIKNGHQTISVA